MMYGCNFDDYISVVHLNDEMCRHGSECRLCERCLTSSMNAGVSNGAARRLIQLPRRVSQLQGVYFNGLSSIDFIYMWKKRPRGRGGVGFCKLVLSGVCNAGFLYLYTFIYCAMKIEYCFVTVTN